MTSPLTEAMETYISEHSAGSKGLPRHSDEETHSESQAPSRLILHGPVSLEQQSSGNLLAYHSAPLAGRPGGHRVQEPRLMAPVNLLGLENERLSLWAHPLWTWRHLLTRLVHTAASWIHTGLMLLNVCSLRDARYRVHTARVATAPNWKGPKSPPAVEWVSCASHPRTPQPRACAQPPDNRDHPKWHMSKPTRQESPHRMPTDVTSGRGATMFVSLGCTMTRRAAGGRRGSGPWQCLPCSGCWLQECVCLAVRIY